jgi:hypothetical protein
MPKKDKTTTHMGHDPMHIAIAITILYSKN